MEKLNHTLHTNVVVKNAFHLGSPLRDAEKQRETVTTSPISYLAGPQFPLISPQVLTFHMLYQQTSYGGEERPKHLYIPLPTSEGE